MSIEQIINNIITTEGGYVNDPSDSGGATCWGITEAVAREWGYSGDMYSLPKQTAYDIYFKKYVTDVGFDKVAELSDAIAYELIDMGVSIGVAYPEKWLRQCLNLFNNGGTYYSDIPEPLSNESSIAKATRRANTLNSLRSFLAKRGKEGEGVMIKALNCLQGARYLEVATQYPKNEKYVYGWLKNRVK